MLFHFILQCKSVNFITISITHCPLLISLSLLSFPFLTLVLSSISPLISTHRSRLRRSASTPVSFHSSLRYQIPAQMVPRPPGPLASPQGGDPDPRWYPVGARSLGSLTLDLVPGTNDSYFSRALFSSFEASAITHNKQERCRSEESSPASRTDTRELR